MLATRNYLSKFSKNAARISAVGALVGWALLSVSCSSGKSANPNGLAVTTAIPATNMPQVNPLLNYGTPSCQLNATQTQGRTFQFTIATSPGISSFQILSVTGSDQSGGSSNFTYTSLSQTGFQGSFPQDAASGGTVTAQINAATSGGQEIPLSCTATVTMAPIQVHLPPNFVPPQITPQTCQANFVPQVSAVILSYYVNLIGSLPAGVQLGAVAEQLIAQVQSGMPVPQAFGTIAQGILNSDSKRTAEVNSYYQHFLHRASDPQGLSYWMGQMQAGQDYKTVVANFTAAQEYWKDNGASNTGFVSGLYRDLLFRVADQQGLSFWVNAMNSGTSALQVAQGFENSAEFSQNYLTYLFKTLLNRAPDSTGMQQMMTQMEGGASEETMILQFLTSQEYIQTHAAVASGGCSEDPSQLYYNPLNPIYGGELFNPIAYNPLIQQSAGVNLSTPVNYNFPTGNW